MDIYLTHGHQADFLNSVLWPVSRFLVRYIWRPLEQLGIPDPTSAAKNHRKKKSSEKRLARWAAQQHHLLITGHTHHPMIGTPPLHIPIPAAVSLLPALPASKSKTAALL